MKGELPSPLAQEYLWGHEKVEKRLRRLIKDNKLPHALLLTGPYGIGKETLACRLARFLCVEEQSLFLQKNLPEAENSLYLSSSHPLFKRFIQRSFGDFLNVSDLEEKTSSSEIGMDAIRNLIQFLHQTPREGKVRCVFINEAHLMNRNAANALLKILEEPPPHVFLILVSSKDHLMLPTLLSRLHKIRLFALDHNTTQKIITQNLKGASDEEINFLVRISKGSPGFAQAVYALGGETFYKQVYVALEALTSPLEREQIPLAVIQNFLEKYKERGLSLDLIYGYFLTILGAFLGLQEQSLPFINRISHSLPIEGRLKLWEDIQSSFKEALEFELDTKQTWMRIFSKIHETFST